jgi:hypothetical protein
VLVVVVAVPPLSPRVHPPRAMKVSLEGRSVRQGHRPHDLTWRPVCPLSMTVVRPVARAGSRTVTVVRFTTL